MKFVSLALVLLALYPGEAAGTKPNFVWIFADDLGYHDIGLRNKDIYSPTLDKLATDGVLFTNQYTQAQCSPSRHAFMTGRYPFKSQMQSSVILPISPDCSALQYKYLPQYLQELGYSTHAVGKWHLGYCRKECLPTSRGFDSFLGLFDGEGDYINHTSMGMYDWNVNEKVDFTAKGVHSETLQLPAMLDIIDEATPEDPFFLYFAAQHPHIPLQPTKEDLEFYKNKDLSETLKGYYALITGLDKMVKAIYDKLVEKDLMDNTYLIFLADNGAELKIGSNEPFRGAKGTLWEGGAKSSSFIYSPLLEKTGYENNGLIHVSDWMPTIISLAGGKVPKSEKIDGIDQTDMIINGGDTKRTTLVYNIDLEYQWDSPTFGEIAVRNERYKLIWGFPGQIDGYGMDTNFLFDIPEYVDIYNSLKTRKKRGRYSFTDLQEDTLEKLKAHYQLSEQNIEEGTGIMQLFDLENDPIESTDLSKSTDPLVMENLKELIEFAQDQISTQYTPYQNKKAKDFFFGVANRNRYFESGWCEKILPLPKNKKKSKKTRRSY